MTRHKVAVVAVALLAALLLMALSLAGPGVAQAKAGSDAPALGTNVYRIPTQEKVVALTFDDCYKTASVNSVLATLAAKGVDATFFLPGDCVASHPAMVGAIMAAGYDIGNHSYSHAWLTKLSNTRIRSEVDKTEAALAALGAGDPRPLFRCPYGAVNARVRAVLGSEGYVNIMWTCDGEDWRSGRTANQVIKTIMRQLKPGAIILMHPDSKPVPKALPELIRQIKARGYTFVNLRDALFSEEATEAQ